MYGDDCDELEKGAWGGSSGGWTSAKFEVPASLAGSVVEFELLFASDEYVNDLGTWVDTFRVVSQGGWAESLRCL